MQPEKLNGEAYFYPNNMGRIVLTALEEVMGKHGVHAVLNLAQLDSLVNNYPPNNLALGFDFETFSRIHQTLDDIFGPRGSRALALRAGREAWKFALREIVPILGITDLAVRTLPLSIKLKIGLDIFVGTFNRFTDQKVRLGEDERGFLWIIERCPICWNRQSDTPCCHFAVGLLQESLQWVSRGRSFNIYEVDCVAMGASTCTIVIEKRPLS
ncbi:MAG: 4-vinyl reductase [Chloroflexota bacterium]